MAHSDRLFFPGLNGLRAIAALCVLLGHTFQPFFADWGFKLYQLPVFNHGVTLFFVISGFLITYLLIVEKEQSHSVDIFKFYVRRVLRIWPLYYLYIGICILVMAFLGRWNVVVNGNLFWYLFFCANVPFIASNGTFLLVHLWSIGVEEQFYLIWPWIVKYSRKVLWVSISLMTIWVFVRYASFAFSFWEHLDKPLIYRITSVNRFQCMMLGAIGALLIHDNSRLLIYFTKRSVQALCWVLIVALPLYEDYLPTVVIPEFVSILSLSLIIGQISLKGWLKLENKAFDFLGRISYAIYVIHPLVIMILSIIWNSLRIDLPVWCQMIIIIVVVTFTTILFADVSYRLFESKFLIFKKRYAIVNSSSSSSDYSLTDDRN